MQEVYKSIVGFSNYEVSNLGNIKTIKTGRILKGSVNGSGYYIVGLCIAGKRSTQMIHRLVADAFLDNPDNKTCVDHIDNNKQNNHILNLRYATHSENAQNRKISTNNKSGTKGVGYNKSANKWKAHISIDGIYIFLGYFDNIEDAIQARIIKANQIFGVYTNACEQINEV